jgi:anti-sigma factor RsiW
MVPRGTDTIDSAIAGHIRALQPGHLADVLFPDEHTVKPWFNGRVDFAPPVKDLASQGFPLIGGRLDFLARRPVAALVYRRAKHVVDLYIWPASSKSPAPEQTGERSTYNFIRWIQGDMVFWAVFDVEKSQLAGFVRLWRSSWSRNDPDGRYGFWGAGATACIPGAGAMTIAGTSPDGCIAPE